MTELTRFQRATLREVYERSSANPITGKDIANKIGLKPRASGKDGADMRSIIHALRMKGYPVLASGKGYYWARDKMELDDYIKGFQGRIDDQQNACSGLGEAYERVGGELPPEAEEVFIFYIPVEGSNSVRQMRIRESKLEEFRALYPNAKPA